MAGAVHPCAHCVFVCKGCVVEKFTCHASSLIVSSSSTTKSARKMRSPKASAAGPALIGRTGLISPSSGSETDDESNSSWSSSRSSPSSSRFCRCGCCSSARRGAGAALRSPDRTRFWRCGFWPLRPRALPGRALEAICLRSCVRSSPAASFCDFLFSASAAASASAPPSSLLLVLS